MSTVQMMSSLVGFTAEDLFRLRAALSRSGVQDIPTLCMALKSGDPTRFLREAKLTHAAALEEKAARLRKECE